ncbi:MAG: Ig-like domain-containing protein [Bacillota bacterium]|nr:Ig-like domain-containing protein [Bacillota bacterium]MDW7684701.1 Ig-like domain-containing protein [Bacillota bacterium]
MKPVPMILALVLTAGLGLFILWQFIPVQDVALNEDELLLAVGEMGDLLDVTITPAFVKDKSLLWESSDPDIVTVDSNGSLVALSPGEADVTVYHRSGNSAEARITVVWPTINWNGGMYTGELVDEVPHGYGHWVHPDGDDYEGEWTDGEWHGQGFLTLSDGTRYEGTFAEGRLHGKILAAWPDGTMEETYWDEGILNENFISYIDAIAVSLKLYESGYDSVPKKERTYQDLFLKDDTRYVNWELVLEKVEPDLSVEFLMDIEWLYENGDVFARESGTFSLEPGSDFTTLRWGRGWNEPGNWTEGRYSVNLKIAGETIANTSFEI